MGTITLFMYKVQYQILTNAAANIDPPSAVGPLVTTMVNAATPNAAVTALLADLSLAGNQRLSIQSIRQEAEYAATIYN